MTVEEIRELINLAKETGVAVLDVQRGDNRVRIRMPRAGGSRHVVAPAGDPAETPRPAAATPAAEPASMEQKGSDPSLVYVKSPIVGTFYDSPSPGSPNFVRVGERIQPGKVLCIIESMKLMNEIEAEIAGVVESKLVMNGQPVEYGEAMFGIRPL